MEKIKNNKNEIYEWCIIGGGITGIVLSELLTRKSNSVILLEKNKKLAGETSADFHEWFHLGSLYSIKKSNNEIIKNLIRSFKHINIFYSEFKNFNIKLNDCGYKVLKTNSKTWFNYDKLEIRYSLKNKKKDFKWISNISRSIQVINKIKNINWHSNSRIKPFTLGINGIFKYFKSYLQILSSSKHYLKLDSCDLTFNSRSMINDLLSNAISNNLKISLENKFLKMDYKKNTEQYYKLESSKSVIFAKNVVFCNGKNISQIFSSQIKTSYAPMIVFENLKKEKSFFQISNNDDEAINCIYKDGGKALVGGSSFPHKHLAETELEKIEKRFLKINKMAKKKHSYIGYKNELISYSNPRNYLYHIWKKTNCDIWAIIPGKFTLAFSAAIDFYLDIFKEYPSSRNYISKNQCLVPDYIAEIKWKV